MVDAAAPVFGLPASLQIPIAAASVADIETYVGRVLQSVTNSDGLPNAVLIELRSQGPIKEPNVPLWTSSLASRAEERLHARKQVWVHVDYDGYRQAYIDFGMPAIPQGYVLDHVQNRIAVQNRGYLHPYLRLCPVRQSVNTSGGHSAGGEGKEKEYLAKYGPLPAINRIIYADPMDLTKMLDIKPGTAPMGMDGVRDTQHLFYP